MNPSHSPIVPFFDLRMRDIHILPDPATRTYYAVSSTIGPRDEPLGRHDVRVLTSTDLLTWHGPHTVFHTTPGFWNGADVRGIWAPEMHAYRGRYYLFLTIDTADRFPEQWRDWLPRVRRGTQVLVADSPLGPFRPFNDGPTLPADMMTLDGTLWVEDSVPYMVFCHEWVQVKDGTVCSVRLADDLSATVGEPVRLFDGSDAPWSKKSPRFGCHVTDGPTFHRSRSGKLFMAWSSGGDGGYTTGIAVSDSGLLCGPWRQLPIPLFTSDGGHPTLFTTFAGDLMMILHQPNTAGHERARLFELEDTGETLHIRGPFNTTPR